MLTRDKKRISLCEKKLGSPLLFDFGVVNTADGDCKQYIYRRTPFTTPNDTSGVTTVVLCLQQLWSDAKSNKRPYLLILFFSL